MRMTFEVPARADYLGLVRMMVAAVVVERRELDDQAVDDVALAVSEACALVLGDGAITVSYTDDDSGVIVEVEDGGRVAQPETPRIPEPGAWDGDTSLGLQLVRALVDEVEVFDRGDHDAVRLKVLCQPVVSQRV